MAKDQNMSINTTKISGVCGRLMCCLAFENPDFGLGSVEGIDDIDDELILDDPPLSDSHEVKYLDTNRPIVTGAVAGTERAPDGQSENPKLDGENK
jgi:hypothetical protein